MWFTKTEYKTIPEESGMSRKELEAELAAHKKLIEDINKSLSECTPMIDFDVMRVFSIERNVSNNKPCTIIGYYMSEPMIIDTEDGKLSQMRDKVREWTLYCSNDQHEKLVQKYLDWKQNKVAL